MFPYIVEPLCTKIYTEWELEEDVEWLELRASKADVITALEENGSVQALDARAKTQFTGKRDGLLQGGCRSAHEQTKE